MFWLEKVFRSFSSFIIAFSLPDNSDDENLNETQIIVPGGAPSQVAPPSGMRARPSSARPAKRVKQPNAATPENVTTVNPTSLLIY